MRQPLLSAGYVPDYFLHDNDPLPDYGNPDPLPETPTTVSRLVEDSRPFVMACSTYAPKVRVTMPRVTLIDGAYRSRRPQAANDNYKDARHAAA